MDLAHTTKEKFMSVALNPGDRLVSSLPYPLNKDYEEFYISNVENGTANQIMSIRPIIPGINVKTKQDYEKLWNQNLVLIIKISKDRLSHVSVLHDKWTVKCTLQHNHNSCGLRHIEIAVGHIFYWLPKGVKTLECKPEDYAKLSAAYVPKFTLPAPSLTIKPVVSAIVPSAPAQQLVFSAAAHSTHPSPQLPTPPSPPKF